MSCGFLITRVNELKALTQALMALSVESVKRTWDQQEMPYNSSPQFLSWLVKYCNMKLKTQ